LEKLFGLLDQFAAAFSTYFVQQGFPALLVARKNAREVSSTTEPKE